MNNTDAHISLHVRLAVLSLAPFSTRQISAFVNAIEQTNPTLREMKLQYFINTVYNLRELASRPFLLHLIVKTIPELRKTPNIPITPAKLYQLYTDQWLDREYGKGEFRWLIKKEQKLAFMTEIAWRMLRNGTLLIHFSQLSDWVRSYFGLDNPESVDHFLHDIRTCSFLHRDESGNYTFVHKSFMEYFVSLRLVQGARANISLASILEGIPARLLSRNSISFFVDIILEGVNVGAENSVLSELVAKEAQLIVVARLIDSLSSETRIRLWRYVLQHPDLSRELEPYLESVKTSPRRLGISFSSATARQKGKWKRGKGRPFCGFCGKEEIAKLLFGTRNSICESCAEHGKIVSTILSLGEAISNDESKKVDCSFCDSRNSMGTNSFKSHDGRVSICGACLGTCADALISRRTRPRAAVPVESPILPK